MASYSHYRSSSRPSGRFPDPQPSDASVEEEIHREFAPGSQYQQWIPGGQERIYERRRIVERHPPAYHPSMYPKHRAWDDDPEFYRHRSRSRPASPRRRSPTPRRRYKDEYTHSSDRGYDGSRDKDFESRSHRKRSPSPDGKGNFKNLALAGVLAATGKSAYDYYRSCSERGRSVSANDERSRPRSRSRTDGSRTDDMSDFYYGRELYHPEDDYYCSDAPGPFRPQPERRRTRSLPGSGYYDDSDRYSISSSDSSSSSVSSSDEERTRRKLLRKELLTAGFATIATLHAGHGLYESKKNRKARLRELKNGTISPEEARKQRLIGDLKDVAGLSLAALGIKKTIDEWKEAAKSHSEYMTHHVKCKERRNKRERRRASVANVDF